MRIECSSARSFLANLENGDVADKKIWFEPSGRAVSELKRIVSVRAAAVLNFADGQALLQYGEECGVDLLDGEPELNGSERAKEIEKKLSEWAESRGIVVLPGYVDI